MTEHSDGRPEPSGHWEGLSRFLGRRSADRHQPRADAPPAAEAPPAADAPPALGVPSAADASPPPEPPAQPEPVAFEREPVAAEPEPVGIDSELAPIDSELAAIDSEPAAADSELGATDSEPADPEDEDVAAAAKAAYEGFEAWVPPWERAMADTAAAPSYSTEEERSIGRFAYAEADGESLPDPEAFEPGLNESHLRAALEAILMVVNEPVLPVVLAQVLEEPTTRIENTLFSMQDEYLVQGRGFELRQVANGWRFYTRAAYASYVERFVLDGQQIRLTQAALETLAVVAYKQPVSRSRVAAIRGVNCDGVIKTLVTRGLVEECGTESDSGAHLYRTTTMFLEKVGINTVDELPSIAPFLPDDIDEFDLAQR